MELLGASLKKFTKRSGIGARVTVSQALDFLKEEMMRRFGAEISNEIEPISIRAGVIRVFAPTPAHRQEIAMHASMILDAMRVKFKRMALNRIEFARESPQQNAEPPDLASLQTD